MKIKISICLLLAIAITSIFSFTANAATISISGDKQFILGLDKTMEYITKDSYDKYDCDIANNPYWTAIAGGSRPDGTKYSPAKLIANNKMAVPSAWYGKTVYFRSKGSKGQGKAILIPAYSNGAYPYKNVIKVLNAYSTDTGGSFYKTYIENLTDSEGNLAGGNNCNITVDQVPIENFNKAPLSYITDAEGNYIYDLIAVGVYTNAEPDISGAAAWALRDYIAEGYGFLIGHDTMYGYGGVTNSSYVPDKNSTTTPVYVNNNCK